jgi:hypothetical protein
MADRISSLPVADPETWARLMNATEGMSSVDLECFCKTLVAALTATFEVRGRIDIIDLRIAISDAADAVAMAPPRLN